MLMENASVILHHQCSAVVFIKPDIFFPRFHPLSAALLVCLTQVYFLACSHTVFPCFFFYIYIFTYLPLFSSHRKTSGTGSPDSVLKKSLLPFSSHYPTTTSSTSSSSSQTDSFSLSTENHHWAKHPSTSKACLSRTTSYPISSSIELISRGPDGRFQNDTMGPRSQKVHGQLAGVWRAVSLHSERMENKEPPFVLSVDLPPCSLTEVVPSGQFCGTAQHLPCHEPYTVESEADTSRFPALSSVCSNSSLATFPTKDSKPTLTFPVLPHIRRGLGQPATNASALVLQMEHEREKGNLNHCLKLAQEREELERELQRYTLERRSTRQQHSGSETQETGDSELLWEYKSRTLPHRYPQGQKQRSALSSSDVSTPPIGWESTAPDLTCANTSMTQHERPAMSSTTGLWLHCGEAGGGSADRWTLPRRSSKKNKKVEAVPKGCNNSPQSAFSETQTDDSCSEKRSSLSRGSMSTLSLHSNKRSERANLAPSSRVEALFPDATDEKVSVEMSVDEPELEESMITPSRLMLHHRIASHLQHNHSPANGSWYEDMRSFASFNQSDSAFGGGSIRSTPPDSRLELSRVRGSRIWNSALQSHSLDLRRHREEEFLNPDMWINSLSQENCSLLSSGCAGSSFVEKQALSSRTISKSPTDFPSTSQPPPSWYSLSPEESSEKLPLNNNMSVNSGSQIKECGLQGAFTERQGSSEMTENASRCVHEDNHLDALEMEAGSFEVVPHSGSYSSYASSGRGSMGPANGRLLVCHLPPSLTTSPETIEESQERSHDEGPHRYLRRSNQCGKFI